MTEDLNDFFNLVNNARKEKGEEELVEEEKSNLSDFFSLVDKAKKEKEDKLQEQKKQQESVIGEVDVDISVDSLFNELKEEKKKDEKRQEQSKKIDDLLGEAAAEVVDSINIPLEEEKEEVIEEKKVELDEDKLLESLSSALNHTVEQVKKKEIIEDAVEEVDTDVIEEALEALEKLNYTKEELQEETDNPEISKIKKELEVLKHVVNVQGGGGEVRLEYLDDVERSSAKTNGYYLKYDSSKDKWVGAPVSGGGGGADSDWVIQEGIGIHTTANVGIATTAKPDIPLFVDGNARITGILTVGTASITFDGDNNNITAGIVTITNTAIYIGDNVTIDGSATGIGSAPNVLYVAKDGDDDKNGTSIDNAFLTIAGAVGAASSGTTIKVLSGNYVETNPIEVPAFVSIVGDDQRTVKVLPNTATSNLFHVRKGVKLANMTFSGHLSPAAAVSFPTTEIAENVGGGKWKGPYIQNCTSDTTTGTGIYIDGDQARSLKAMNVDAFTQYNQGGVGVAVTNNGFAQLVSVFTICCNEAISCDKGGQADIANSNCSFGTYGLVSRGVGDLQFTGVVTSSAAVSQDNVTVNLTTPTYNITGVDYTHTTGIATVTVSSAHKFKVGMGITLSSISFNCAYGSRTYPYRNPYIFEVESIPSTTSFSCNLGISTVAHTYSSGGTAKIDIDRPYDGQLVYFDELYQSIKTISVGSGGTGYSATPKVTIAAPTGPSGETATAFATLDGDKVSTISIISSGSQYKATPTITIEGPQSGVNTATATANLAPIYYTINSSTPIVSGITTLTLEQNLFNTVGVGSTAFLSQASKIIASSHTFEYVGAGNNITTATPKRGGVTIQANEVVTEDGGQVIYTSTDQSGNFRIGDELAINQSSGTISGRAFTKSLFSEMTPFILALS